MRAILAMAVLAFTACGAGTVPNDPCACVGGDVVIVIEGPDGTITDVVCRGDAGDVTTRPGECGATQ